jgi:WD40 repeat protein
MIKFSCKSCGQKLNVDDKHSGKRVKCPVCQNIILVPISHTKPLEPAAPDYSTHTNQVKNQYKQELEEINNKDEGDLRLIFSVGIFSFIVVIGIIFLVYILQSSGKIPYFFHNREKIFDSNLQSRQIAPGTEKISPTLEQNMLPNPPSKIISSGMGASWSPNHSMLVYSKPTDGGLQILDLTTHQSTTLTIKGKDAVWSPDGRYIAYVQEPVFNSYSNEEVWVIKPNGQDARRIANGGYPRWSKDGTTLYVHLRINNQIMAINIDDNQAIPEVFFEKTLSWYPSISPDGKLIAFGSNGKLTIIERTTGKIILSYDVNGERGLLMSWSPDGRYITYGGFDNSRLGLWCLDLSTSKAVCLAEGAFTLPMWSEDGKQMSFDYRSGSTREIWIAGSDWFESRLKNQVPPLKYLHQ